VTPADDRLCDPYIAATALELLRESARLRDQVGPATTVGKPTDKAAASASDRSPNSSDLLEEK
jgi:hypothetical protein